MLDVDVRQPEIFDGKAGDAADVEQTLDSEL